MTQRSGQESVSWRGIRFGRTAPLSVHVPTWRNCDSPHRLSTAFWQIDDSGAWIPPCSQTAPSINETTIRTFIHHRRSNIKQSVISVMLTQKAIQFLLFIHEVELRVCRVFLHVYGSTYLSWPDFNIKVVPLVWNLEYFGPSETIYPEPVFVNQEPVGTHA